MGGQNHQDFHDALLCLGLKDGERGYACRLQLWPLDDVPRRRWRKLAIATPTASAPGTHQRISSPTLAPAGDRVTVDSTRIEPLLSGVMRGLDPRIHLLAKRMDCRVKPGNDHGSTSPGNAVKHSVVMAGLVPAIHVWVSARKGVDAGTSPGMTVERAVMNWRMH